MVYLTALVVGVLMGLHFGKKWITSTPFFDITLLEIRGNDLITRQEIKKLARIEPNQNIFTLDKKGVQRRVIEYPWMKEVSVKRKLPRTIRISVLERKPMAALHGEIKALLDEDGVVLDVMNSSFQGVPLIVGEQEGPVRPGQKITGRRTLEALEILRTVSALPFITGEDLSRVDMRTPGYEKIYIRGQMFPIVLGSDSIGDKLRRYYSIRDHIKNENRPVKYIDLTFDGKVVVNYQ
jgi:cell division protein FtsQ